MTEGVNEHYMTEGMEVSDYPGDPIEQEQRRKTKEGLVFKQGVLFQAREEPFSTVTGKLIRLDSYSLVMPEHYLSVESSKVGIFKDRTPIIQGGMEKSRKGGGETKDIFSTRI